MKSLKKIHFYLILNDNFFVIDVFVFDYSCYLVLVDFGVVVLCCCLLFDPPVNLNPIQFADNIHPT